MDPVADLAATLVDTAMPTLLPKISLPTPAAPLRGSAPQTSDEWTLVTVLARHIGSAERLGLARHCKRASDVVLTLVALILLSPLLIGVALAVALTSQGPVLFAQTRVGKGGRLFKFYKFRSMVVNAEDLKIALAGQNEKDGPIFKMAHDPRVTRLGRTLRKYSLDELPQLINVLRGDMSLVGPRPPVPSEVVRYETWQLRRLSVTPGLTCIWQTSGRSRVSFEDWMRMDLDYIDSWSLTLDAKLILKTFATVIAADGAY